MKKNNAMPILMGILGNCIFGLSFIFTKLAFNIKGVNPFILLAYRFILAFAVMNILLLFNRGLVSLKGKKLYRVIMLGLLQPVIYFICENYGLLHSTATFSSVMISLIPICSIIFGALFLKEKTTLPQIAFSIVSVAGVILLSINQSQSGILDIMGIIFMIGAVISASGFNYLSRSCSKDFTPFERTYVMFALSSVFFGILAVAENIGNPMALLAPLSSGMFWIALAYLGILSSVIAFIAINYANTYLPLSRSTSFSNITTVVSVAASMAFLHEACTPVILLSCILIIAGVVGVQKTGRKDTK